LRVVPVAERENASSVGNGLAFSMAAEEVRLSGTRTCGAPH